MRGILSGKLGVLERVHDAGSLFNTGEKQDGDEGGKKGYISSSSCDILVLLVLLVNTHQTAQLSSYGTTRHLIDQKPQNDI